MEVTYDAAIVTADAGSTSALARFRAPVALALLGGVLLLVGVIGFVQGGGEAIRRLPGYLARVFTDRADLGLAQSLGAWRFMALPMVVAALVVLARNRRDRPVDPLELGILLIAALVAGPLSWVHYSTWAVLSLVLLADQRRWRGLTPVHATAVFVAITTALFLLTTVVAEPEASSFAQRLTSGPHLVAEVLLFGASFFLLRRNPIERPAPTQPPPGRGVRARSSTRPGDLSLVR